MPKRKQRNATAELNMQQIRELMNNVMTDEARMKLVISLYYRAMHGNMAAFKLILQILGELPTDKKKTTSEPVEYVLSWGTGPEEPEQF